MDHEQDNLQNLVQYLNSYFNGRITASETRAQQDCAGLHTLITNVELDGNDLSTDGIQSTSSSARDYYTGNNVGVGLLGKTGRAGTVQSLCCVS